MITLTQRVIFLAFLGSALVLLPACGSNQNVKSDKAAETVLAPEPTPVPTMDMSAGEKQEHPIGSYTENIKRTKNGKETKISVTPAATTESTPASTPIAAPVVDTAVPPAKGGGSHWFWWVLLVLVLGGVGLFLKNRNQSGDYSQPNPPVGGLSPVSGFTGLKTKIEEEAEPEPSFWTKKLF